MKKKLLLLAFYGIATVAFGQNHKFIFGVNIGPGISTIENSDYYGQQSANGLDPGLVYSSGVQAEVRFNPVFSLVFNPNLQIESNEGSIQYGTETQHLKLESYGFSIPFLMRFSGGEDLRFFVNAGFGHIFIYNTDYSQTSNNLPEQNYSQTTAANVQLIFGGGLEYAVNDNVLMCLEMRNYYQPKNVNLVTPFNGGSDFTVNKMLFTLGVFYGF